jgi:hypothetical protein
MIKGYFLQKKKRGLAIINEVFFYIFPLPIFFVLHRWNEVRGLVSLSDSLPSVCVLLGLTLVFFFTSILFYRNEQKASLFSFGALSIFLFYPFNDFSKAHVRFLESPIISLLLLALVSLIFFLIILRLKNYPARLRKLLTILMPVLIGFEILLAIINAVKEEPARPVSFLKKDELANQIKAHPSVYVILMDEYAGLGALKRHASFDNQLFTTRLESLGFRVINEPQSNYNYTIISMASLLNGDYNSYPNDDKYTYGLSRIKHNRVVSSFREIGYDFVNISPFTIEAQPRFYKYFFLPGNSNLILRPTILDDVMEFLPLFITRRLPDKTLLKKWISVKTAINIQVLDTLLAASKQKRTSPLFCYTHVMMPHGMYARDSMGKINTSFLTNLNIGVKDKQEAYLQYLIYTNKTILPYVNQLKKNTGDSAIILLISDHGSRDIAADKDKSIAFSNFAAVYYPKEIPMSWYDGISNVNFFRVLFSDISGKKITLLKDSVIVR